MANIIKDLERQFTIVNIDFYDNGEDVEYFIFYADEFTRYQIEIIYDEYEEKYNEDLFDGTFEDYLEELNINFGKLD